MDKQIANSQESFFAASEACWFLLAYLVALGAF